MIALWAAAFLVGLIVASLASRRAVTHALRAADASQVSSGFIGMTVMAIGTDLPEIANSIISAATSHGDLNVGDSAGSAVTQVTLVLGILCFSTRLTSDRVTVTLLGAITAAALITIGFLIQDGSFGRGDGTLLLLGWLLVLLAMRTLSEERSTFVAESRRLGGDIARTGGWLVVVALAATVVVQSFVAITESIPSVRLVPRLSATRHLGRSDVRNNSTASRRNSSGFFDRRPMRAPPSPAHNRAGCGVHQTGATSRRRVRCVQ